MLDTLLLVLNYYFMVAVPVIFPTCITVVSIRIGKVWGANLPFQWIGLRVLVFSPTIVFTNPLVNVWSILPLRLMAKNRYAIEQVGKATKKGSWALDPDQA
jgi:hypothetical protein